MARVVVISNSSVLKTLVPMIVPSLDVVWMDRQSSHTIAEDERLRVIETASGDTSLRSQLRACSCAGIPCVVIGTHRDLKDVIQIIRAGAVDYVTKPVTRRRLGEALRDALNLLGMHPGNGPGAAEPPTHGLTKYQSAAMLELSTRVKKYASTAAPVLITGESGTGKEVVARAIHDASSRAAARFVPRNCGAIPRELFESDMFGVATGAYTGSHPRKGAFVCASGGSLFLDEVGELSPSGQVALLRVLETGVVRPVGSDRMQRVDVRVIAATNRNLVQAVREKSFRLDLLYRLDVLSLRVPPLRERQEDLFVLSGEILDEAFPYGGYRLTPAALKLLRGLPYRGNVREFRNLLVRAAVLSDTSCVGDGAVLQALNSALHLGELLAGSDSLCSYHGNPTPG
ncbi:MAG: sigma-54-dependent transcriptional regulator [Spirochaetota bacterium]